MIDRDTEGIFKVRMNKIKWIRFSTKSHDVVEMNPWWVQQHFFTQTKTLHKLQNLRNKEYLKTTHWYDWTCPPIHEFLNFYHSKKQHFNYLIISGFGQKCSIWVFTFRKCKHWFDAFTYRNRVLVRLVAIP